MQGLPSMNRAFVYSLNVNTPQVGAPMSATLELRVYPRTEDLELLTRLGRSIGTPNEGEVLIEILARLCDREPPDVGQVQQQVLVRETPTGTVYERPVRQIDLNGD